MTKRIITMALTLTFVLSCIVSAGAVTQVAPRRVTTGTCGDNLTWILDDDGTLTISGEGNMTNGISFFGIPLTSFTSGGLQPNKVKSIVIQQGCKSIGDLAFYGFSNLTSVSISESVTRIGLKAFENSGYYNDESNWENGVLYYQCSDDDSYYLIAANSSKGFASTEYSIKEGTKCIAGGAFYNCSTLTSVNIPSSVTKIGIGAFNDSGFYSNASNWENGVLYAQCSDDNSYYLIEANTSKGFNATEYTIREGTKYVADMAFYSCSSLVSVNIPDSVIFIGNCTFGDDGSNSQYCSALTTINVGADNNNYVSVNGVLFNKTMTELVKYPAAHASTTYTIPSGVIDIDEAAINNCANLTSITVPGDVTCIGDTFLDKCTALSVVYFNGNPTIGSNAFNGDKALIYHLGADVDLTNADNTPVKASSTTQYIFEGYYNKTPTDPTAEAIAQSTITTFQNTAVASRSGNMDVYARWREVGAVSKNIDDSNRLPISYGDEYREFELVGAQIKNASSGQGLRFITSLSNSLVSDLTITDYGYVAGVASNITGSGKIKDGDTGVKKISCLQSGDANHKYYEGNDGYIVYSLVITYGDDDLSGTGMSVSDAKEADIIARPYVTFTDAQNVVRTVYMDYTGTATKGGLSISFNDALGYFQNIKR